MERSQCERRTVPIGIAPATPDDGLAPWDESIVPDWSWCRGWRVEQLNANGQWEAV